MLGIQRSLSSSYHPQTDGQMERTNQTLKELLRNYIEYDQSDWDIWLPIVEYTYNDSRHTSTGMTPFYADYGRNVSPIIRHDRTETKVDSAEKLATKLIEISENVTKGLVQAARRQEKQANRHRRDYQFQIDDLVLVKMSQFSPDIYKDLPNKKLGPKWVGPYKVIKRIGNAACKLDLPASSRVHPMLHVSTLRPYFEPDNSRCLKRPLPILIDTQEEYEVESILKSQV